MMTLPVIITFCFFRIFFLLCCLVFEMGHLMFDFELISGVVVAETFCMSSYELRCNAEEVALEYLEKWDHN